MKPKLYPHPLQSGYALITVLCIAAVSLIVLAAAVRRTNGVTNLNERNNMFNECQNAAEAAVEKIVARMSYDFHANGLGVVANNLSVYRGMVPNTAEDAHWANFQFSDGTTQSRTAVTLLQTYAGPMPSQFPGLQTMTGPIYRIMSTASQTSGGRTVSATVQQDILLALVPLPQWAIFGNALVEFSTCATMVVNGRVHANNSIYVGTDSSLTFNSPVTATGTITAPNNAGGSWGTNPNNWNTDFNGNPPYTTNVPTVSLNFNTTNAHSMIEIPPVGLAADSDAGRAYVYNNAHVILTVADTGVTVEIQAAPAPASVPGADLSPIVLTNTLAKATNFPFLSVTTTMTDQRELSKTVKLTQIDIAQYSNWLRTNASIATKFSGTYPTILYVQDKRSTTSSQMTGVRLINGTSLPVNGGAGFSVATANALYVKGHYNCTNSSHLGTTNTSSTVPAALMADALTILSSSWNDSKSASTYTSRSAVNTTVNACLMAGMVPSTGTTTSTFSGGIHNFPRLLEDWTGDTLTLNTSMLYLYNSQSATNKFIWPGTYYKPPTRKFSYDYNFLQLNRQPPGIPTALMAVRVNWSAM